jgi:hypothetical protein
MRKGFDALCGMVCSQMQRNPLSGEVFIVRCRILKQDGVVLAESTINNWFAATADLLEPLYNEIWKQIKNTDHLFVDGSTIPVQSVDKPGGTLKNYHWIFKGINPHIVFFVLQQRFTFKTHHTGDIARLSRHGAMRWLSGL